ncbi:hypothetical protein K438DRAFT_1869749, partial [Mycena galopus ATCC 62051]
MTNNMGLSTILPTELWLLLFSHLYLPELVSVSAACSAFQALASESFAEHRGLRHHFHHIGRDDDSGHGHEHAYWYRHLLTLLREPAAAYYVEVLTAKYTNTRLTSDPLTVLPLSSVDEALIREAVEGEGWIPDTEKEKFVNQLLAGDEHAMVTLMILRLPNLKWLTLPSHWDIKHLMPIVVRIAGTASKADPDEGPTLPLSKLEHYEVHLESGSYGVDFESIAPLMVLPSLRTMCTPYNSEGGFNWPASLPKSRLCRIDIPNGQITRDVIVDLARHIRGPCVIRQVPTRFNETPEDVDWNVLEIPFAGASEEEWTIEGGLDADDLDD